MAEGYTSLQRKQAGPVTLTHLGVLQLSTKQQILVSVSRRAGQLEKLWSWTSLVIAVSLHPQAFPGTLLQGKAEENAFSKHLNLSGGGVQQISSKGNGFDKASEQINSDTSRGQDENEGFVFLSFFLKHTK